MSLPTTPPLHRIELHAASVLLALAPDHPARHAARRLESALRRSGSRIVVLATERLDGSCAALRELHRSARGDLDLDRLVTLGPGARHVRSAIRVDAPDAQVVGAALGLDPELVRAGGSRLDLLACLADAVGRRVIDECLRDARIDDELARWVLAASGATGVPVRVDVLESVLDASSHQVAAAIALLERSGLLVVDGRRVSPIAPIVHERLQATDTVLARITTIVRRDLLHAIRDHPGAVPAAPDELRMLLTTAAHAAPTVAAELCDQLADRRHGDAHVAIVLDTLASIRGRLPATAARRATLVGRRLRRWHVTDETRWLPRGDLHGADRWIRLVRRARSGGPADIAFLHRMLELASHDEHDGWMRMARGIAHSLEGRWRPAIDELTAARRIARTTADDELSVEVALSLSSAASWCADDAWAQQVEAIERARTAGTTGDVARATATGFDIALEHGLLDRWDRVHALAAAAVDAEPTIDCAARALLDGARLAHEVLVASPRPQPPDAATLVLDDDAPLVPTDAALAAILAAGALLERGDAALADSFVAAAERWTARSGFASFDVEVQLLRARSEELAGRRSDALRRLCAARACADEHMTIARHALQLARARALHDDGSSVAVDERLSDAHARLQLSRAPYVDVAILELEAHLDDRIDQADHIVDAWQQHGLTLEALRLEAVVAIRRRDTRRADRLRDRARRHGIGSLADELAAWLRSHGLHRVGSSEPAARAAGSDPLTARQRTVLDLHHAGMDNRAIAARLGVSDRYVRRLLAEARARLHDATEASA